MQFHIGDLLKKFKTLVPREKIVKDEMISAVFEETGILLQSEEISFQNGVIFIKTNPVIKNELFMRKQKILLEIKKKIGDAFPHDIR